MRALGQWIAIFWQWLKTHNESIVALATAIQAIAVVFAVYQVTLTKTQIEDARRGLQANVELQIQHDGRDLLSSLNPDVRNYVYANQALKPEAEREAQLKVIELLNYYASISRQHGMDAVDDGFWEVTKKEFCFFLIHDHVRPIWDAAVKSSSYAPAFVEVGKQCLAKAEG
jgi:hypothetical protein